MVGAIVLTLYNKKSNVTLRKQDIYKQLQRQETILIIQDKK